MPKLLYFDLGGRAMPIRLLLTHAGVDFSDDTVSWDDDTEWFVLKQEFPERGGLPWYTDDNGKVFTQSRAILKALAMANGYISNDAWVQFESDWVFEQFIDHAEANTTLILSHMPSIF